MLKFQQRIDKFLNRSNVENAIMTLIVINLIAFVLQTDAGVNRRFYYILDFVEAFSVGVFTIEYFLRVISLKKFKDIFNFYMVVDLCAILPFYLSFVTVNTTFLRALRLFRLFRVAKFARYSDAFENIKNAFAKRKNELIITGIIFIFAVFISSTLIYFAENQTGVKTFSSIPNAFWWAVVTFTTVGYGDAYPITFLGKIIASFTAIFGVGLHGLLIGIISTALMDVINERAKLKKISSAKAQNCEAEKVLEKT